jgi:hypothetical protein
VVGYHEPSLVFLLGTRTRFVDAREAAALLQAGSSRAAIVTSSTTSEFIAEARARDVSLRRISTIDGIDPVHGRPIELDVWSARADAKSCNSQAPAMQGLERPRPARSR